jgi:geranylgeranyl pyrophosphate synthase
MSERAPHTDSAARSAILAVPADRQVRGRIRKAARRLAEGMPTDHAPARNELEQQAQALLDELDLGPQHQGFAMVAVSNEFWRDRFAAVPPHERVLLLPHCLRAHGTCPATYDETGLHCTACGACDLAELSARARDLGYNVIIAEGTPAVVRTALSAGAGAMLGVACLDSLERAFGRLGRLGVPYIAVPLLTDGCVDTEAETDTLYDWIEVQSDEAVQDIPSYRPLLRAAERLFDVDHMDSLLTPLLGGAEDRRADLTRATDLLAVDWIERGGKRFRPFMVLASYAALAIGQSPPPAGHAGLDGLPRGVQLAAVAIETLHKASLVHDDIEDDDEFRYGRETLHRGHGLATAINVGDHLVGLGYRCICAAADDLGTDCTNDILSHLTDAHLKLCRGQGAELIALRDRARLGPAEVQRIYALKTAPAFEAALYAGVRCAGEDWRDPTMLRSYCRYIGVAYQVANDLKDWERDERDKLVAGQDALANRPTLIRALAEQAGYEEPEAPADDPEAVLAARRRAYQELGVFDKAQQLVDEYGRRALDAAEGMPSAALAGFLRFVVETIL